MKETESMADMPALGGLRVIDFSRIAPGPMATMVLADFGADIIKVEEPGGGRRARDERRLRGLDGSRWSEHELRLRSISPLDRNKRTIALDLKTEPGRHIALDLVRGADIVVEGFRPGVMGRLGLDYEAVRKVNEKIIYCSISGYGQTGPRAAVVGHDLNYLADSSALSLIGTRDGRPVVPINLLADYSAGSLRAVIGILLAVIARRETGLGQLVDVAMTDGLVALLAMEVASLIATGTTPAAGQTRLTGGAAYYDVYETKDGRWLTVGCNEPHFFANLCDALALPELKEQMLGDAQDQAITREILQRKFRQRTLAEWSTTLSQEEIAWAPVRRIDELVNDVHYLERGAVIQIDDPSHGTITQVGPLVPLSGTPGQVRTLAPRPGEQTRQILRDLGFSSESIEGLYRDGVVA
jgi:crotonobetainyl-CoA:carnitine CoA-transferase CaiB-like acyl-CoA transferase